MKAHHLSTKQKIAVLFLSFGQEVASELFRHMSKEDVKEIARTMQQMGRLSQEVVDEVITEFYSLLHADTQTLVGGKNVIQRILAKAFNKDEAESISQDLKRSSARLDAVERVDGATLASLIGREHPQTIALILAFCDAKKCGEALKNLPQSLHTDIMLRLANLDGVSSDMVDEIDAALEEKIRQLGNPLDIKKGGVDSLAAMLATMDKEGGEQMLETLALRDSELAAAIKERMFTFEDLQAIPDLSLQTIFKHIPPGDWKLALKISSPELKEKVFRNMSERAAKLLSEDLEAMPLVRKADVEAAQRLIVKKVQSLDKQGIISLAGDVV